jgi:hypothetical protein
MTDMTVAGNIAFYPTASGIKSLGSGGNPWSAIFGAEIRANSFGVYSDSSMSSNRLMTLDNQGAYPNTANMNLGNTPGVNKWANIYGQHFAVGDTWQVGSDYYHPIDMYNNANMIFRTLRSSQALALLHTGIDTQYTTPFGFMVLRGLDVTNSTVMDYVWIAGGSNSNSRGGNININNMGGYSIFNVDGTGGSGSSAGKTTINTATLNITSNNLTVTPSAFSVFGQTAQPQQSWSSSDITSGRAMMNKLANLFYVFGFFANQPSSIPTSWT